MSRLSYCVLIVAGAFAGSLAATPVLSFNEATGQTGNSGFTGTGGWFFQFNMGGPALVITGLSWWDEGKDGLAMAHTVGIWDTSTGQLLRSAVIPAGTTATLEGQWRTVAITPLTITSNPQNADYYAIGGTMSESDTDRHVFQTTLTSRDARLGLILPDGYAHGQSGFAMPDSYTPDTGNGNFGPSFSVAPAPEPTCMVLAVLPTITLLRRKR